MLFKRWNYHQKRIIGHNVVLDGRGMRARFTQVQRLTKTQIKTCTRASLSCTSWPNVVNMSRWWPDSLNLPVVRQHEYADIKSGEYFGEFSFVAMCKKLLEVRDSVGDSVLRSYVRLKRAGHGHTMNCWLFYKKLQDNHSLSNDTPEKVNMPELTAFFILLTLNSSNNVVFRKYAQQQTSSVPRVQRVENAIRQYCK